MIYDINILKGIHPGAVIARDLEKRKLARGKFALSIGEYPQRISEIIKGKRNMNTPLSLKIEKALGYDEGFLMTLQVFYDIKMEHHRQADHSTPNLTKFSRTLFWDTDMSKIDWQRHKRAVIQRVLERGDEDEKGEIIRFYGPEAVEALKSPESTYRIAYLDTQHHNDNGKKSGI